MTSLPRAVCRRPRLGRAALPFCLALAALASLAAPAAAQTAAPSAFLAELLFTDADHDGVASCGDTLNYILTFSTTLTNPPVDEQGVVLSMNYDPNLQVVPGSVIVANPTPDGTATIVSGNSPGDRTLLVNLGHVHETAPQNGVSVQLFMTIAPPSVGTTISMQATFTGQNFSPIASNVSTTPFAPCAAAGAPDLAVSKTASSASAPAGGSLVYTLAYRNNGTAATAGAVLSEAVPSHTSFDASASTPGWSCAPSGCSFPLGPVAAGASGAVLFAVRLDPTFPAGTSSISNTVCVAAEGDTNANNNCSTVTTPTTARPDLTLTKSASSGSVAPGATLRYTLLYKNAGAQDATGVTLSETVPLNTTFSSADSTPGWNCSPTSGGGTCSVPVGTVPAGASGSVTFAVVVVSPLPAGVSAIGNTACAAASGDPNAGNNCGSTTTPTTGSPQIQVTKTAGSGTASPGATLVYILAYKNVGTQGAAAVTLRETIPADTTFDAAASSPGWSCSPNASAGSACTLAAGALAAGASGTATFAVDIAATLPAGVSSVANTACADPGGSCSSVTTPTTAKPDLLVVKTASAGSVAPGASLSYRLAYRNVGSQDATAASLVETVPAHTSFDAASSTPGWSCAPPSPPAEAPQCTLLLGAVAAGASGSATFAVRVDPTLPAGTTAIVNTACAAAPSDPNAGNDCSSTNTPTTGAPDLSLTKTANAASAVPGATLVYRLAFANRGNQDAAGVSLTETIPANSTFDSGDSALAWTCTGATCTFPVGTVAAGDSGFVLFAARVANPLGAGVTAIDNFACAAAAGDSVPTNNCASLSVPTSGAPILTLTKSASAPTFSPGDTLTYTLAYANAGNQDASAVSLSETVPANTRFAAASSSPGWICAPDETAGSSCTLAVGPLGAGQSGSATFAVTVATPLPPTVTAIGNSACATMAAPAAPTSDRRLAGLPSHCSTVTTPRQGLLDLALRKSTTTTTGFAGSSVVYSLDYQNAGAAPATAVVLHETVPANASFDAAHSDPGWACSPNGQAGAACTLSLPDVPAGGQGNALFAIIVRKILPKDPPPLTNTACVSAPGDPNPGNDCATVTTPLDPAPAPADVPTLGSLGLLAFALLLAAGGLRRARLEAAR